jgi:membrane protein implicated in regulation of membrane protease activity
MLWWLWIVLGGGLLVLEIATPGGFYFIFFGVSALIVGILAAAGVTNTAWIEWMLFSLFAIGATAFLRRPLLKHLGVGTPSRDVDSLVGETATAMEGIQAGAWGKAELRGSSWTACNAGAADLVRGQRCRVERVDGLSLFIRSAESGNSSN